MNSNCIYTPKTDRTPYFYIIQHIESGKFYAGSRWAKGCHPNEFMEEDGYCTSSPTIERIIEAEGIDSFRIHTLMTEDVCGIAAYAYETRFLRDNKIAQRDNWFNGHNNSSKSAFGTVEFSKIIMKIYGVDNVSHSKEVQERKRETCLENNGVNWPMQSESILSKSRETCLEKYGVPFVSQVPEIREKQKEACMIKYGVDNPSKLPLVREKALKTFREKYGVDHPMLVSELKEKFRTTCQENLGVDHPSKSQDIKNKKIQTELKNSGFEHSMKNPEFLAQRVLQYNAKTGVDWPMQNQDVRDKSKEACMIKYGVDNPAKSSQVKASISKTHNDRYGVSNVSKARCVCPYCGYETGLNSFSRHTKVCFPSHGVEWIKPKDSDEWKTYFVK